MARTPLQMAIFEDGRSQRDIAAAAGIGETYLSKIVNGHPVGDGTAASLADTLGRTVDELWPTHVDQAAA